MNLLRTLIKKHVFFIFFFFSIVIYDFIVVGAFKPWCVTGELYSFHLVDFSMGFCSRFLPGAIYNFLFDNTSVGAITLYCTVLFIVLVAIVSIMLEKFIKLVEVDCRHTLMFLLIYFLFGTFTFSVYTYRLGSIDFYWVMFSVFSISCLSNKKFYFLLIPLSLLSVISNYGSLVCYIPLIILIAIYKITTLSEKKEKSLLTLVLFILTVASYSLGFYFLMFEHNNLTYSFEEFKKILNERGYTEFPTYFAMSLYETDLYDSLMGYELDKSLIDSADSPIISAIAVVFYRVLATLSIINFRNGAVPFFLALPIVMLIFAYFKRKSSESNNKLTKTVYFGICVMFFATIVFSLFLSVDVTRFISHAYTALFVSALYVIYNEKGKDLKLIAEYIQRIPIWIITPYTFCFLFMIFDPCG